MNRLLTGGFFVVAIILATFALIGRASNMGSPVPAGVDCRPDQPMAKVSGCPHRP